MNKEIIYLILLFASTLFILFVNNHVSKFKKQLARIFSLSFILIILWNISLILQICFSKYTNPIYFDYVAYIGICFLPVTILLMGKVFANTRIKFNKKYFLLFVIPIISLLVLWTNDSHHLFYEQYSTRIKDTVFGPYFYIHTIYSYACIAIGIIYFIYYTIRNSGFFSRQSLLIYLGAIISLAINAISTFGIMDLSIYITPISFTLEILLITLAIFKFNFLNVAPIALQRIVDRMSDSYIVIDESYRIIDFNKPFLDAIKTNSSTLRNKNVYNVLVDSSDLMFSKEELENTFKAVYKDTTKTIVLEKNSHSSNRYFNVEISSISSKGSVIRNINFI